MAPLVRTGGSRHTGLAALPHRNIHILFYRKIDIPINVENKIVKLENGELTFCVYPKYQYSKEAFSIGFAHHIIICMRAAIVLQTYLEQNL